MVDSAMLCAGQVYRATLTIDGQSTPPSSATLAITKPDGTLVTPAPAVGTGSQAGPDWVITYDYLLPTPGLFKFTWQTQGPGTAPPPEYQNVRDFISILSTDEARDFLGAWDTARLDTLRLFMAAATRITERTVGTCVARTYTGDWIDGTTRPVVKLQHGPLPNEAALTRIYSVYTGGPSWDSTELIVFPAASTARLRSGQWFWYGPWKADYTAGRLIIGEDIVNGCKQILWDLWGTQRGLNTDTDYPDIEQVVAIEAGYRLARRCGSCCPGSSSPASPDWGYARHRRDMHLNTPGPGQDH